ncbi:hypothetical protein GCM10023225_01490 [Kineococcus glutinatus]|uniref:Peptidase S1 domain-containing protein n=1 Tax=Kineococcus glutinatus TaxID=1070872 RepID=A0ABP9H3Q7_9ACTN
MAAGRRRAVPALLAGAALGAATALGPIGSASAAPPPGSDQARGVSTPGAAPGAKGADVPDVRPRTAPVKGPEVPPRPLDPPPGIVGGTTAATGAYPWFVSVQTAGGFHFCGGTLVSSTRVVTAAHCVDGGTTPANLRVKIGGNVLSNTTDGEYRNVSAIAIHPSWNAGTFANDVAVLTLSTASTKRWTRLAGPGDPTGAGQTVRAIGHGATSEGGAGSDALRQVDLPIQSDATMSSPGVYGGSFIGNVMVGAGPLAGGQDTCQGDSGGPLFVNSGSQPPLVGDTSWGTGCARPNKPGIYGELYQGPLRTFVDSNVPRPGNDTFAGAAIAGAAGLVSGSNTNATSQPGEAPGGTTPDTTVWYTWTAPESGPTTFNTANASFDTVLDVFTGGSVGALGLVATNDDTGGTLQSEVTFNATAGTTYRVRVDGFGATHGTFSLNWAQNPPANDDFAARAALSGATGKTSASNARATAQPGEPSHWTAPHASLWYAWTAPESGSARFNTRESGFDTTLAVYTGTALNALTNVTRSDDVNSTQSRVAFAATAGTTYLIAVDGYGSATGTVGLQWTVNPPANDDFAAARVIGGAHGSTSATTVRATGEPGERDYHGGAIADNSAWFSWTPSTSGPGVIRLRDVSGGLAPGIGVYTGTNVAGLTGVGEGATRADFTATAGTTYRIAVDGNGGSTGGFVLEWLIATCEGQPATIVGTGAFNGTAGNDVIIGSTAVDTVNGGGGDDRICGLAGNDVINGGPGNDRLFGQDGDDQFTVTGAASDGTDLVSGAGGSDLATYTGRTAALSLSLDGVSNDGLPGENDRLTTDVERVTGGSGPDTITGSSAANTLLGAGGNDTVFGRGGNDGINGGTGNDRLLGEDGNDRLNLVDGVSGNDRGDGGAGTDTGSLDSGDVLVNVP